MMSAGARVQVESFRYVTATSAFAAGAAFLLSALFLVSLSRRWRRAAFSLGLAIPFILLLELVLGFHVVSWPGFKNGEHVIALFPVQNAAREIIVGTHYSLEKETRAPEDQFDAIISAFLLPMSLAMTALGLWQLVMYLAKFESEDARTIMFIMGAVCMIYYALWFGKSLEGVMKPAARVDSTENVGSVAALMAVARDLSNRNPRLQNTSVTIAFFGGSRAQASGARAFARKLSNKRQRGLPTSFVGFEQIGRSRRYCYLMPDNVRMNALYVDRQLIRTLNRAAAAVTDRELEPMPSGVTDSVGFATYGFPATTIAALPRENTSELEKEDNGALLVGVELIEQALLEFDSRLTR